ncbi:MAG: DUF4160 domain-containing protein [Candidatus Ozemobacteraceae bacterium]|jgi:hypothetical protein
MPTIIRQAGFLVVIYPNDHPPPHVHVLRKDGRAKILLKCDAQKNDLVLVFGFTMKQSMDAVKIVTEANEKLLLAWRKIHG